MCALKRSLLVFKCDPRIEQALRPVELALDGTFEKRLAPGQVAMTSISEERIIVSYMNNNRIGEVEIY